MIIKGRVFLEARVLLRRRNETAEDMVSANKHVLSSGWRPHKTNCPFSETTLFILRGGAMIIKWVYNNIITE